MWYFLWLGLRLRKEFYSYVSSHLGCIWSCSGRRTDFAFVMIYCSAFNWCLGDKKAAGSLFSHASILNCYDYIINYISTKISIVELSKHYELRILYYQRVVMKSMKKWIEESAAGRLSRLRELNRLNRQVACFCGFVLLYILFGEPFLHLLCKKFKHRIYVAFCFCWGLKVFHSFILCESLSFFSTNPSLSFQVTLVTH